MRRHAGQPHRLLLRSLRWRIVPFPGFAQVINAMIGKQVELGFMVPSVALPQAKAGKIKLFAVSTNSRSTLLPELPPIVLLAIGIALIDARALVWLLPVGLPLLLSIPMTVITSRTGVGKALLAQNYLLIPEETKSPAVLRRAWLHASRISKPRLQAA